MQKIHIPNYLYWDDTPDPPSGLCIEKGHVFRKNDQKLCTPPERFLIATEEEEIENKFMFSSEDYENMKYEDPLIKDLRDCEVRDRNAKGFCSTYIKDLNCSWIY